MAEQAQQPLPFALTGQGTDHSPMPEAQLRPVLSPDITDPPAEEANR